MHFRDQILRMNIIGCFDFILPDNDGHAIMDL